MRILILLAHPKASVSIAQKALSSAAKSVSGVTVHDLYAAYPDFNINAAREQQLLLEHDAIIFQHPFYWYSSPALIKEWQDIVLDFGWAYGPGGDKLHGKCLMSALTTGGAEGFYHSKGRNRFSVEELLSPFNQTAYLCGMAYLKPFIVYEGRRITPADLQAKSESYRNVLEDLAQNRMDPKKHLATGYTLPDGFKRRQAP
jgi:glutathione-regulated potassium-efflux system ancillary protein KefG